MHLTDLIPGQPDRRKIRAKNEAVTQILWRLLQGEGDTLPDSRLRSHWCQMTDLIQRHRLGGLIHSVSRLPAPFIREFELDWKQNRLKNIYFKSELVSLGQEFKLSPARVVLLKGSALLGDVYTDGERHLSDIDILAAQTHYRVVREIFIRNDFAEHSNRGDRIQFTKFKGGFELTFDLRFQLWPGMASWSDRPSGIDGFYVLTPEDQILHLCHHLVLQHTFENLNWLIDIHRYLIYYKNILEKKTLLARAKEVKGTLSLWLALMLCRRYLNTPIPQDMLIRPKGIASWIGDLVDGQFLWFRDHFALRTLAIKQLLKTDRRIPS